MTRKSISQPHATQTEPRFSRYAVSLTLGLVLAGLGGCRFAERVYHDTGRSLHGSSGGGYIANGECTTKHGKHRIVVNGARGAQATEETLFEENLDERKFAGATMPAIHTAIYTLQRTSGERTVVKVEASRLSVNDKPYGVLKDGDSVTIDGDKVFINTQETPQLASN